MSNFLILIGGPGLYKSCDPEHDQTWLNYIVPVQAAAIYDLYKKGGDRVHWILYEPAYRSRWLEDDEIDFWEGLFEFFSGRELHKVRKEHAEAVKKKGATNYLHRVQMIAMKHNITYKGIDAPNGFWDYIRSFPDGSISRVWFSGHATKTGLILELTHSSSCVATWEDSSTVLTANIETHKNLRTRFLADTKHSSQFYGCNTSGFASTWNKVFGVPAEGAGASITYEGVLNDLPNVLKNLQTTPTSEGPPKWTTFGADSR